MSTISPVAAKLRALRLRAGFSLREVAEGLGMERASSYQHYEARYRKPYLPLDVAERLAPLFAARGVAEAETLALAGIAGHVGEKIGEPALFGRLSKNTEFRLYFDGPAGAVEFDRLIRRLQLAAEIAADEPSERAKRR